MHTKPPFPRRLRGERAARGSLASAVTQTRAESCLSAHSVGHTRAALASPPLPHYHKRYEKGIYSHHRGRKQTGFGARQTWVQLGQEP